MNGLKWEVGRCQVVRLFDAATGKPMGEPIKHSMEMIEISLNYFGDAQPRLIHIGTAAPAAHPPPWLVVGPILQNRFDRRSS